MSAVLGSNYILTWTSDNLPSTDYVIVELQVNGGSWTTLNSYYPNSGSYSWYVVGHIGDVLVFRISDWQQPLDINATTDNIVIIAPSAINLISFSGTISTTIIMKDFMISTHDNDIMINTISGITLHLSGYTFAQD